MAKINKRDNIHIFRNWQCADFPRIVLDTIFFLFGVIEHLKLLLLLLLDTYLPFPWRFGSQEQLWSLALAVVVDVDDVVVVVANVAAY